MDKLTLIFPIETIARELDSRLVLASLYGCQRHRILLAHTPHANRLAAQLKGGGLYVGKHIMATGGQEPKEYYQAKKNNFTVIQLAEEGAVFMGKPEDWESDLDWQFRPSFLSKEDYVATWGDWQKEHYLKRGAPNPENVRTTGHPRFDLCKSFLRNIYREESEQLRLRFGKFILFNSNFSWVINPLGVEDTFSRWQGYYPEDNKSRLRFVQRWSRHSRVFAEYVELIHRLAIQYSDFNLVVRPHPSDDIQQMKAVFQGVENIHIIREGSVAPWILASQVMLNDGCTTAIEAYLMGKRVVNFTPVNDEHEAFLPNLLGTRVIDQKEAVLAIDEAMNSSEAATTKALPEMAHRVFANFHQDSMRLFLDLLQEAESRTSLTNKKLTVTMLFEESKAFAIEHGKQLARRIFSEKRYRSAESMRVLFPGFNKRYIKNRLDSIEKITARHVNMKYYSPWLVELNPVSLNVSRWPL